jgi:hypothetical protein
MEWKNKTHFLVALGALLFISVACRKPEFAADACQSGCYVLEGYLSDTFSNEPLADARVNLRHWKGQWNYWVAEAKTDATGYWKLSVDASYFENSEEYVSLQFETPGYLEDKAHFLLDSAMIDVPQQVNRKLFRSAFVDVSIAVTSGKNIGAFMLKYSSAFKEDHVLLNGPAPIDTTLRLEVATNVLTKIRGYTFAGSDLYENEISITVSDGSQPAVSFIF